MLVSICVAKLNTWASDVTEERKDGAWVREILLKKIWLANVESFKYGYVRPVIVRSL